MKNRERIEQLEARVTRLEEQYIRPAESVDEAAEKLKEVTTACDGWFTESQRAVRQVQELEKALRVRANEYEQLRAENARLVAERENLRGAMAAQDGRERAAGEKCGVSYDIHGCDWPDAVAEEVNRLCGIYDRARSAETERDALRARINSGTVVYSDAYSPHWYNYQSAVDKRTARLIDIAPISDAGDVADERKGERRVLVPDYETSDRSHYSMDIKDPWIPNKRKTTRRRTPGTIVDRKAGSNE
jgi:hypothetical protein